MHRFKKTGRVAFFFFFFFFLANAFTLRRKCNLQCHPVVLRRKDAERRGLSVAHVIWLLRAAGRVGEGWLGGGASWRSGSLVLSPLLAAEMEK